MRKIKIIFVILLTMVSIAMVSNAENDNASAGYYTKYQKADDAIRMGTAWYDWKILIPADSPTDTIILDSLYGKGVICRQVTNRTNSDGRFIALTDKGTYYVPYPVQAGQPTGTLPQIVRFLKTGNTIDTMVLFIQKR